MVISKTEAVSIKPPKIETAVFNIKGSAPYVQARFSGRQQTMTDLKQARKKLGLSLSKAAAQVDVSARTWCRWESGESKMPEAARKLFYLLNKRTLKKP